jgi:hypothetical protein
MGGHVIELPALLLGWLLGLLSPAIIEAIRVKYRRRDLAAAIRAEAQDLQYRAASMSFILAKQSGDLTREYLVWLKPKLAQYKGNEPVQAVREIVEKLVEAPDQDLLAVAIHMRAEKGIGLSLKRIRASLIEASMASIVHFPPEYQLRIHEFRNQLDVLNQEIEATRESLWMTYDSSLSKENHERIEEDLVRKYNFVRGISMRVADRLQAIIDFDVRGL